MITNITNNGAIQIYKYGSFDFTMVVEKINDFIFPIEKFIGNSKFIASKNIIFNVHREKNIAICHNFETAKIFGNTYNIDFIYDIIAISKEFSNTIDRISRKLLFTEFQEKINKIDMIKWIEFSSFIESLFSPSIDRIKKCLDDIYYLIQSYNITKNNNLFCFYGSIAHSPYIDKTKISIDFYEDYFLTSDHIFAMFYYPNNNTFYIIDPDKDDNDFVEKYFSLLQELCKRFNFRPSARVIQGRKIQEYTDDCLCSIHTLDYFRQISINPNILEKNDNDITEYLLRDYIDLDGNIDPMLLYTKYNELYL